MTSFNQECPQHPILLLFHYESTQLLYFQLSPFQYFIFQLMLNRLVYSHKSQVLKLFVCPSTYWVQLLHQLEIFRCIALFYDIYNDALLFYCLQLHMYHLHQFVLDLFGLLKFMTTFLQWKISYFPLSQWKCEHLRNLGKVCFYIEGKNINSYQSIPFFNPNYLASLFMKKVQAKLLYWVFP